MRTRTSKLLVLLSLLLLAAVAAGPAVAAEEGRIDINTATKEELATLDNIGPAKADKIIEYRQKTPFETIEDLMNVSGVGQATFDANKDRITVGGGAEASGTDKKQ